VPSPRDDGHLDVLVAELGQALSQEWTDQDFVVPAAGDQERRPGNGRRVVDPRSVANDLFPVCQRWVELGLGRCPRLELDLGP